MKILWDLKILWETGSRRAKILWDFVSQCEVWHVWYLLAEKFSSSVMFSKKEFAIVSNLRFISMKNFMLNWVEHEKKFITSGPVLHCLHMPETIFRFAQLIWHYCSNNLDKSSADQEDQFQF